MKNLYPFASIMLVTIAVLWVDTISLQPELSSRKYTTLTIPLATAKVSPQPARNLHV